MRVVLISGLLSTAPAYAGTTTADFLGWSEAQQRSFFHTSMSMLTTIAAQSKPEMAECLNGWYYASEGLDQKRHAEIVAIMPEYKAFHPSTVVLAYVENFCGKFETN